MCSYIDRIVSKYETVLLKYFVERFTCKIIIIIRKFSVNLIKTFNWILYFFKKIFQAYYKDIIINLSFE